MTFRGPGFTNPTPWPRLEETWIQRHVQFAGLDTVPFNQKDWPNPVPPYRIEQTSTVDHTNFLNKDKFYGPSGKAPTFDYPNPVPPFRMEQTWIWRQVDKLGKDKLPFRQQDWPNPTPAYRIDETWAETGNALTGIVVRLPFNQANWPNPTQPSRLDQFWWESFSTPGALKAPFTQDDWPLPGQFSRLDETYTYSYNVNLIGQDKLPNRQQDWPTPTPVQWYQTWQVDLLQTTLIPPPSRPFPYQLDWPNPTPVTWYRDWNNALVINMPVFMPSIVTNWDVPTSISWYQNWQVSLLQTTLATTPQSPFNQLDWPNPIPVTWYRDWNSRYTLFGQDQLPNRQQDWPNPKSVLWYQDWKQSPQVPVIVFPFSQDDWPLPGQPSRIDQTWTKTYNLFGQDRLPNRQQDWPTLFGYPGYQLDRSWYNSLLQTTLFTTPALPNIRQYDWPNPGTYSPLVPSWTYTSQFIVPAPVIPLFLTGGRQLGPGPESRYQSELKQLITERLILEAAAKLGRKGAEARNQNMTADQRSKAASHAAQTRWKK